MAFSRPVNIIIPVYKEELTNNEILSFRRCVKILSKYPITLVCPEHLNIQLYIDNYKYINVERFNSFYFRSIQGYNRLLISSEFYKRFKSYEYILIYQLDAWVFRDELIYWCSLGYDYIGAPWFEGWTNVQPDAKCIGVGNGGFSLRKVKSHLKFSSSYLLWINKKEIFSALCKGDKKDFFRILVSFFKGLYSNNIGTVRRRFGFNEDRFWSVIVSDNYSNFKIPDAKEASRFSFEMNPYGLYESTEHRLPFGCHAWEKNLDFWGRFFIEEY